MNFLCPTAGGFLFISGKDCLFFPAAETKYLIFCPAVLKWKAERKGKYEKDHRIFRLW